MTRPGNENEKDSVHNHDHHDGPVLTPGIYLVGTPIGNLQDITLRALQVLAGADVLACEDTRVTRKLFSRHGLSAPAAIVSCNDHNEQAVAPRLVRMAIGGKVVAFTSDAGMPGVSDPGHILVREALQAGVPVDVIPGPSAVATAVAMSGMPASMFTFFGFPPRRDGRVTQILRDHGGLRPALVFYESPRRLGRLLALAADACGGERLGAVCLELTKKFQRVKRGRLDELAAFFMNDETRGEAVVVIAGGGRGRGGPDDAEDDGGDDSDHPDEPAVGT